MKEIYTRKHAYSFLFCVALGFDLLGIILHIILIIQKKDIISVMASIIVLPLLSLIFWFAYLIEKRSIIVIEADSITFHYHVFIKPKMKYNYKQGLKIFYSNIKEINTKLHKGDKILSADTNFYNLKLTNGTIITFTLFHFGKKQEKMIYENIKKTFYEYQKK